MKREDLQPIRSFKIRGAYNKIIKNKSDNLKIVCASAGNHGMGVAYVCNKLNIPCVIIIPSNTPLQKSNSLSKLNCEIIFNGTTVQESITQAKIYSKENNYLFIHPYDDLDIIEGQSTIYNELKDMNFNYISVCVGGGGLLSGIMSKFNNENIIACEPETSPNLIPCLRNGKPMEIDIKDTFVDGATVSVIGDNNWEIIKKRLDKLKHYVMDNGLICSMIVELYQNCGIIMEPAGALSVCALEMCKFDKDDKIVCIISGGNNDLTRYPEILERSLRYKEIRHYYLIEFPPRPGMLKEFVMKVLDIEDDIIRFEYVKKTNSSCGSALVGIETKNINRLNDNLKKYKFKYSYLNNDNLVYKYII